MKTLILAKVKNSDDIRPNWVPFGVREGKLTLGECTEIVRHANYFDKVFKVMVKYFDDNLDMDISEETYRAECEDQNAVIPTEMMLEITRLQEVIHETFENRSDFNLRNIVFLFSLGTLIAQILVLILLLLLR